MNAAARKAGFGRRLVAAAIDFVVVGIAGFVVVIATGAFEDAEDYAGNILARIVAFGFLTYFLVNGLLLWRRSQTVGKAFLGLVVVAAGTDTPAPLSRLVVRAPFFIALYGIFSRLARADRARGPSVHLRRQTTLPARSHLRHGGCASASSGLPGDGVDCRCCGLTLRRHGGSMITSMPRVAIATRDFEGCVDTFRHDYGLPVIDLSPGSVESLGAKLAMCVPEGGSNIELMSPAEPQAPLSQSLSRFLERRGEGLFALMLEAPDPDREAVGLTERGLNVLPLMAGAGGRDVHPNSTDGVLIRVYPTKSFGGETSPSASGLSGIMRVIVAVRDLAHARRAYETGFGLACDAAHDDDLRGVRAFICRPPAGGVIEFVTPTDVDRPFARDVATFLEDRPGLYALVLHGETPRESATVFGARIIVECAA